MATIIVRSGKGSPLTQAEVDQNFINLNTDKLDTSGLALGSAASPSLSFTGDLNTGIYSPGADQVALATAGTGRLFVDATGRIGIGTSAPIQKLTVVGSSNDTIDETAGILKLITGGGNGLLFGTKTSSPYQSYIQSAFVADTSVAQYSLLLNPLGGNVGIGTTSPGYLLDVAGTTRIGAATGDATLKIGAGASANRNAYIDLVGDTTYTDYGTRIIRQGGGANADSRIQHRGTGALALETAEAGAAITFIQQPGERARIDSSGRLLVGTSSAYNDQLLQVVGGNTARIRIHRNVDDQYESAITLSKARGAASQLVSNNDILGQVKFEGTDGTTSLIAARISAEVDGTPGANDMPGRLVFSTTADGAASPTERMRLDSSGNMFFNTAVNPTTNNATGIFNILQDKASSDAINLKHTVDGNNSINIWQTGTTVFNALTFYKGNTQTGVGSISVSTTATSYNTSSDYRLKENIVSLTGAVERLNQLQVHRFNFLADPNHTVDGFIAHEAQAVVPECVTGEKDAVDSDGNPVYQGIDQSKLVPLLTAALQEAIGEIESLKARLTAAGI